MGYYTNGRVTPMTTLALTIGEDSELIAVVASSSDPDLIVPLSYTSPSDFANVETMTTVPPIGSTPANRKAGLIVTGMKPGRTTLNTFVITSPYASSTIGALQVEVSDLVEPNIDLYYFGRYLVWRHNLPPSVAGSNYLVFSASSGNLPIASAQNQPEDGPVPEGAYRFSARLDPLQSTVAQANTALPKEPGTDGPISNTRQGIQFLPIGGNGLVYPNWGSMRVRLEPTTTMPAQRTGGFYLHNSAKGYTHGCVEVGKSVEAARSDFFTLLVEYATSSASKTFLTLKVKYRTPDTSTRGNTKI